MSGRPAAALLVLAACALLVLPACGADEPEAEFPPTEPGAVPPGGFLEDEVELAIEDRATADIIGTAVLTPTEETTTRVIVQLDTYPEEGGSAEIRDGGCEQPDAEVVHELGPLDDGRAEATVDTGLEDLLAGRHGLYALGPGGEELGCALIAPFGTE